jgi:hypothetical protein
LPELTMPQVIPPSPAAMELAKYTANPVNLSNGLVQISIPSTRSSTGTSASRSPA